MRGLGAPDGVMAGWEVETGARTVAETGVVGGVCATGALASTGRRPVRRPGVTGVVGAGEAEGIGATFDAGGSVEGCGRMLKIGGLGVRGGGFGAAGVVGVAGCGRTITTGVDGVRVGAFATTGTYTGRGAANPGSQPAASGDLAPD